MNPNRKWHYHSKWLLFPLIQLILNTIPQIESNRTKHFNNETKQYRREHDWLIFLIRLIHLPCSMPTYVTELEHNGHVGVEDIQIDSHCDLVWFIVGYHLWFLRLGMSRTCYHVIKDSLREKVLIISSGFWNLSNN